MRPTENEGKAAAMTGKRTLSVWAQGDAHVGRDKAHGRDSFAEALIQSETGDGHGAPPFHWDFAINVGDYCGDVGVPTDEEGEEVVRHRDKIIVSVHHYMLKETTLASGLWEGMKKGPDGN